MKVRCLALSPTANVVLVKISNAVPAEIRSIARLLTVRTGAPTQSREAAGGTKGGETGQEVKLFADDLTGCGKS